MTEASSEAAVPSGIYARLNQMFIDDNYRLDLDDMATLVSGVLSSVSLDESIPSVLASSPASASTGILPTSTYSCSGVDVTQKVTGFVVNKSGAFTHDAPEIVHLTAVDGSSHVWADAVARRRDPLARAPTSTCDAVQMRAAHS